VRLRSILRGWQDEHVYVQPKPGEFAAVLRELAAACKAAGVEVEERPLPRAMTLSIDVLRFFAKGALDPIVSEEPTMLKGNQLELYLYPADLLIRGNQKLVAKVRANLTHTSIERHAYLVTDAEAQEIEVEIQRMWDVLARHKGPEELGTVAVSRLREIHHELEEALIDFDDWTILDRSLRRLEMKMLNSPRVLGKA